MALHYTAFLIPPVELSRANSAASLRSAGVTPNILREVPGSIPGAAHVNSVLHPAFQQRSTEDLFRLLEQACFGFLIHVRIFANWLLGLVA